VTGPHVPLPALPIGSLTPQPLQPLEPTPLEALLQDAIALGTLVLDAASPLLLGPALLLPLALEPLGDRLTAAPERDHVGVPAAQPHLGPVCRSPAGLTAAARSRISDGIVPGEPHAAEV
jgi:hypothetical protein